MMHILLIWSRSCCKMIWGKTPTHKQCIFIRWLLGSISNDTLNKRNEYVVHKIDMETCSFLFLFAFCFLLRFIWRPFQLIYCIHECYMNFVLCLFSSLFWNRASCLRFALWEEGKKIAELQSNEYALYIIHCHIDIGIWKKIPVKSLINVESTPSISFKCETTKMSLTHIITHLLLFLFSCLCFLNWLMSSFYDQSTWVFVLLRFRWDFFWHFFFSLLLIWHGNVSQYYQLEINERHR